MISVCMPAHNGEKYIRQQAESILSQLGKNDELIISDDRSTDRTMEIITSLNDSRIRIYSHAKVKNPYKGTYAVIYDVYKNVENALKHASGNYVFLSDQDDIWLPGKVERAMQEFIKGAECILHDAMIIDKNDKILAKSYFALKRPSHSFIRLITHCFYQGASMAFTEAIKELSLPFPDRPPVSHDHWIAYIARSYGNNIVFIREPLMLYRRHGNNVSPTSEKSNNSLYFKISYRFNLLYTWFIAKCRKK